MIREAAVRAQTFAQTELRPLAHELDRTDLGALDRFLRSDRSPPNGMMLSELDGFLTGLAVGPVPVWPSEWLPLVWGGEEPAFASPDEATAIVGSLTARYNEILREIADDALAPIFWTDRDDGTIIAADWCEGFVQAIKLRVDAWKPLLTSRRSGRFLGLILLPCRDENGRPLLGLAPAADDRLVERTTEFIPDCVMEIAAYWRRWRSGPNPMTPAPGFRSEPHRAAGKAGRNDPCPCGSGKKFKRCCGRAI